MAAPQPEDHLAAYAQIQREADREILAELRNAFKDTTRQLSVLARQGNKELERARVLAVRKAILEEQAKFYERMGDVVQRRRVGAAARAINVSGRYDEAVFRRAGRAEDLEALSESLEETEARAPEALVARLTPGGSRTNLSQRVYRTRAYTQGLLERRINSALARGLTADEFAREVRDLINPNTPGGVRFAALRLARSEINNAYHAMAIRAAELKPWVTGVEWHMSDSHSRPDRCDQLNKEVFSPPSACPPKPHPQCMCYITQVIGDPNKSDEENDDAFLDDLIEGVFDGFLEEHGANRQAEPAAAPAPAPAPKPAARKATKKAARPKAPVAEPVQEPAPRPVVGTPAAARTDDWLNENLAPEVAEAARRAYDACNERVPKNASFRIRSVGTYDRRTTPKHFHKIMDRGAYASCSGGHIVVQGSLVENRRKIRDAMDHGRFIRHNTRQDELDYTLAHEMGHALTVGRLSQDEQDQIIAMVAGIMGWDADTVAALKGLPGEDQMAVHLSEGKDRKAFEAKFGKYAGSNMDEFLAEVWSAYALDPEGCDPDFRRIGELLVSFIDAGITQAQIDEIAARYKAMYGEDLT